MKEARLFGDMAHVALPAVSGRASLDRAVGLAYLGAGWSALAGALAVTLAAPAGSVALLALGAASLVDAAAALAALQRAFAGRGRFVAGALLLAAILLGLGAFRSLLGLDPPRPAPLGALLAAASVAGFLALDRAKRRLARASGGRIAVPEGFRLPTVLHVALLVLAGLALGALAGWWWMDPLAGVAATIPLAREATDEWQGAAQPD